MSAMFGDFVRQCNDMYDLIIKLASARIERRACENHAMRGKRDGSAVKSIWCSFRSSDPSTHIQDLITPGSRNPTPPWAAGSTYRLMDPPPSSHFIKSYPKEKCIRRNAAAFWHAQWQATRDDSRRAEWEIDIPAWPFLTSTLEIVEIPRRQRSLQCGASFHL